MGKKKKTPQEMMEEYMNVAIDGYERWLHIFFNSCNDPFWKDGTNLNLCKNHVLYGLYKVKEIAEENGLDLPDEYYEVFIPPVVPYEYENRSEQAKIRMSKLPRKKKLVGLAEKPRIAWADKVTLDIPLFSDEIAYVYGRVWNDEI